MDDQGSKVAESRHYPYGEERWRWPEEGTFPTDYRFTGQRSDSYIKLVHMGARHYDPYISRFISPDTIIPQPGDPQSLNRYSYCLNNPLRFVDPTGHFTEEELIEWGAYTEEELKWLAENQANWYNYLMQAVLGDAFMFARLWAGGVGQFLLDDSDKLFIGGAFRTEEIGFQTGGSVQAWGNAIGQATIQEGFLAPEERLFPNAPNPHVQLSPKAEKVHAEIVMGIDIAATLVTDVGYLIALIDTLALPMDPAGKAFGFFLTNVGSGISTLSLLDTLITSGPNSRGFAVSATTYAAGWSSIIPIVGAPLDLTAAHGQLLHDYYTLKRITMRTP